MPEISRFYGIIIKMIYQDTGQHNKPHVHVYYGDYRARSEERRVGKEC